MDKSTSQDGIKQINNGIQFQANIIYIIDDENKYDWQENEQLRVSIKT